MTARAARDGATDVADLGHGIYQLPTDYPEVCNAPLWTYLVADNDTFALVDPGVISTLEATLAAAVRTVGFGREEAGLILATHGHPDHSGGVSPWALAANGVRVAAPLADTAWVESFDRQWTQFWDDYPGTLDVRGARAGIEALCVPEPRVDLPLRDRDIVMIGGRELEVIETRGHTWGHCAYFESSSGALFTGDAVQGHGTRSSDGTDMFAPLYLDVADARTGLQRLLDVPFQLMCPAHAAPLPRAEGLEFLRDSLAFIDEVDDLARSLVRRSATSPFRTADLATLIASMAGTDPPLTPQTVPTARAHLYALAREGLLDAAWMPAKARR
jgi:glyoxylase-like metal-dependent hydrolase (beta-lactamase superfamily II)